MIQREVTIREFVQVSDVWKSTTEEVKKLPRFSGNTG